MSSIESAFYNHMQFDTDQAVDLRAAYLDYFNEANRILELAPGDGAFLEKLQAMGKQVVGVDNDPGMVARAQKRGLTIVEADVFSFLQQSSETFDGIYASHLVEHLEGAALVELLQQCRQALTAQGVLVVVTPNPASLFTQLHEFWRDPTHKRPYTLELLCFLFEFCGFEVIASGGNPNFQVETHQLFSGIEAYQQFQRDPNRSAPAATTPPPTAAAQPFQPNIVHKAVNFVRRWIVGPQLVEFDALRRRVTLLEEVVRHNAQATKQFMTDLHPSNEIFVVGRVKE